MAANLLSALAAAQQAARLQHRDATCDLADTTSGASGSAAATRTLRCQAG